MKSIILFIVTAGIFVFGTSFSVQAQTRASQTSSARAAYGNPAPFRSHVKKNKRSKRKAQKSAKRKKALPNSTPYRRLPM